MENSVFAEMLDCNESRILSAHSHSDGLGFRKVQSGFHDPLRRRREADLPGNWMRRAVDGFLYFSHCKLALYAS